MIAFRLSQSVPIPLSPTAAARQDLLAQPTQRSDEGRKPNLVEPAPTPPQGNEARPLDAIDA
jgi:hypothetical protein